MVAWPTVCKPTMMGGLGISDLRLAGYALQARWLWLQRTDEDRAWNQLPIKTAPQVQAFFRASTVMTFGDGRQALFWEDNWLQGESIRDYAPYLYQFVSKRTRETQTVRQALTQRQWVRSITRGLSVVAITEYLHLWEATELIHLTDQPDRLVWRWTQDGCYTAQSAYKMLYLGSTKFRGHQLVWKTWAPLRIKIFLWLAFRKRH